MTKKVTPRELEALSLLKESTFSNPFSAKRFALLMWPDSNMHTKISNQGNGATRGKAAWLCAGSYLGKLKKKKLVHSTINPDGYYLTELGKSILKSNSQP